MKKVKFEKEIPLRNGKTKILVRYEWCFTEDEKDSIRGAFSKSFLSGKTKRVACEGNIKTFISHLEFLCQGQKPLLEQPKKIDVREERARIIKDCKAALKHLKKIERGRQTWYRETLDSYGSGKDDAVSNFIDRQIQGAWDAAGPLEKFIDLFETYQESEVKKIGRKKADSDHFIRRIRDIYIEHIGKPTMQADGPFFGVTRAVLESLDLPSTDPSRAIKEALKGVS